jgi:hypothetical protein
MKKIVLLLTVVAVLPMQAQLQLTKLKKKIKIEVINPSSESRTDEPVTVKIPEGKFRSVTVFDGKQEIPSQMDDTDENGSADELAFVINLKPSEKRILTLLFSEKQQPANRYPSRVHAQMFFRDKQKGTITPTDTASSPTGDLYYSLHHHGPAFESELMAYRLYFDRKQTVDLYGKKHKGLELAESLWYPTDEQLARGFGDDILRVSGSVGIGTLKGWNGTKAVHIEPVSSREARIVAKGPVRTIVDMNVRGWQYQGDTLDVKSRFILFAGQREVEVIQQFTSPASKRHSYVTGVQHIKGCEQLSDHEGMTAIWGCDWPVNDTVKYGKQTVGLAVEIPKKYIGRELSDKSNYLYEIKPDADNRIQYRMTVCAEKEDFGVKNAAEFFRYVALWRKNVP